MSNGRATVVSGMTDGRHVAPHLVWLQAVSLDRKGAYTERYVTQRYSVPFFCEPGVEAMVGERGKEVRYEEFVLEKMGMWVEFQDAMEEEERTSLASNVSGVISAF